MSTPALTLYHYSVSAQSMMLRMVLHEKSLACERVSVDLLRGETRSASFLEVNPFGRIPVLVVDGEAVWDSRAILALLEELAPRPPLLPPGPVARARVRRLIAGLFDHFLTPYYASIAARMEQANAARFDTDHAPTRAGEVDEKMARYLEWVEAELGDGRTCLVGEMFTQADIALFAALRSVRLTGRVEPDPSLRRLAAWRERIAQRPSARTVRF